MSTRTLAVHLLAASAVTLGCGACILKTDIVGSAFNGGALNTGSDPFRIPSDLAASRVARILEEELPDGYFQQGDKGGVLHLFEDEAENIGAFRDAVHALNSSNTTAGTDVRDRAKTLLSSVSSLPARGAPPLCKLNPNPSTDSAIPDREAIEAFVDGVRFKQALSRAATRVAALELEGLVDDTELARGAKEGFDRTAAYLRNRKWARREDVKTAALAVQGGAATGIFSAGVVWTTLHLIDGWRTKQEQRGGTGASLDIDFHLVSGTSTGAMVSVAVNRFSAAKTHQGRLREMQKLAKWFTCYSFEDLMCVQSTGLNSLVGTDSKAIQGALVFDGIQKLLTSCVKQWMFSDPAELIMNTTEFRSGRIFALSDQNELTDIPGVTQSALASALLPVIGEPGTSVPANKGRFDVPYDSRDPSRTQPAYLDGGIRSELPILTLVRRGAERVLAVGSGPSIIDETKRMANALDIAARFIDLNTGTVKETEIQYAQRQAESMRLAEIDACMSTLDPSDGSAKARCDDQGDGKSSPFCSRWNICHGDFADACSPDAKSVATLRADEQRHTTAVQLEPFWAMDTIFLDESSVDGLPGYDFSQPALRDLFRAGSEAARVRCLDLARLLGVLPEHRRATPEQLREVNGWCSAQMDLPSATCGFEVPTTSTPFVVRACNDPIDLTKLPEKLNDCPGPEDPL